MKIIPQGYEVNDGFLQVWGWYDNEKDALDKVSELQAIGRKAMSVASPEPQWVRDAEQHRNDDVYAEFD